MVQDRLVLVLVCAAVWCYEEIASAHTPPFIFIRHTYTRAAHVWFSSEQAVLETAQKDSACRDLQALEQNLAELSIDNTGRQVLYSTLLLSLLYFRL